MRDFIKIKFICTGNTCRSPMAEGIFCRMACGRLPHAKITSAGLCTRAGLPASQNAIAACSEIDIDISEHLSQPLTAEDISQTDIFFVMTSDHAQALKAYGVETEKIYVPQRIADPYGGDIEIYRRTRDMLTAECEIFLQTLKSEFMRIEPLKSEALPFAAQIEKACFAHPWSEAELAKSLSFDHTRFFIAMAGETALGYIGMETAADEGHIFNVAVFPRYRRQGVANALADRLIMSARELNLSLLTLEVRKSNAPAVALYKKLGFETVAERKNYYSSPCENAVLMTKFFTKC